MADSGPSNSLGGQPSASGSKVDVPKKPIVPLRAIPPMLQPLTYMGIPESVLRWKPRLPSRNWTIFLTVTGSLTSMYYYDRNQCKKIRQEYKDKVQYLAEQPMHPSERPRKINIYSAKSPGDDDPDKSLLFFKKYVKPIIVAAALDYETLNGTRHGGLGREIRERIFSRRRQLLQLEPWGTPPSTSASAAPDVLLQSVTPFSRSPQQQLEDELDGAIVIVGRPAYKEWAWGLKAGWTSPLPPVRQQGFDESLANELSEDSTFDEVVEPSQAGNFVSDDTPEADGAGAPLPSKFSSSPQSYNPAFQMNNKGNQSPLQARQEDGPNIDPRLLEPPSSIPAQPPLYFVNYTNLTGIKNLPRKMVGFFNERAKVRQGGQAAIAIALGNKNDARDFNALVDEEGNLLKESVPQGEDLDWGLETERFYPKRFHKTLKEIEKARKNFYDNLPRRIQDTRSYVRGERELTVSEKNDPPKSEGKLREERFEKEREWRTLELGYSILRPESGLEWHRAFLGSLRVLKDKDLHKEEGDLASA